MGLTGVLTGVFFGFTTKMGSNALQKVPLRRQPWEYLIFMGIGGVLGNYVQKKHNQDLKEIEELRLYLERKPSPVREEE